MQTRPATTTECSLFDKTQCLHCALHCSAAANEHFAPAVHSRVYAGEREKKIQKRKSRAERNRTGGVKRGGERQINSVYIYAHSERDEAKRGKEAEEALLVRIFPKHLRARLPALLRGGPETGDRARTDCRVTRIGLVPDNLLSAANNSDGYFSGAA